MDETKVTTIEDHIKRAKELTIPQVSVREEAFTELVKAVEMLNEYAKTSFLAWEKILGAKTQPDTNDEEE